MINAICCLLPLVTTTVSADNLSQFAPAPGRHWLPSGMGQAGPQVAVHGCNCMVMIVNGW